MRAPAAPIRLAVVGCGRVFERFHLPALRRVAELEPVALCDPIEERLRRAREGLPGPAGAASLEELLAAGPVAEAALLLTPPATHAPLAERALGAGLHVLVEKPMALDSAAARRMADAARLAGRRLQVGFARRFRAPYAALRARLRAAGRPVASASAELSVPSAAWGARTEFLGNPARGGGVLDDVLSHQVDLLRWVLGTEIRRIRAEGSETAAVRCEVELGCGVVARCGAAHGPYREYLEVALEGGRVLAASGAALREWTGGPRRSFPLRALLADRVALAAGRLLGRPGATAESFARQLRDFARAVRGGPADGAAAEDGVAAVAAVEACRESLRDGGWREVT